MISVIIPVHNHSNKIGKCLFSILDQNISDMELIIVDDGSSDGLGRAVETYKKEFEKKGIPFKFFVQSNQGAPSARNRGFFASRGEFLLFCDADAILERGALQKMLSKLKQNKDCGYAYSNFYWGVKKFRLFPFDGEKLKEMPYIHTMSLMRREVFPEEGWDESIKKLQDWDLYLSILERGNGGCWIDEFLFTISPGGTISNWLPSFAYKFFPFLPSVRKYKKAVGAIKQKHNL